MKPEPVIVTFVPTGPLVGVKLVMPGITLNCLLLVSVPDGVVTVTKPVVPERVNEFPERVNEFETSGARV